MERKKVAITGISGYLGRILLPLLETDNDIECMVGFDRTTPGEQKPGSKLKFHLLDIRDPQLETFLEGCDTLVHLAFQVMRLPGDTDHEDINIKGMRATCEAAARHGIRKLIIASSVVAYGMRADNPSILTEESPLRPNEELYYGLAKASNELFLDDFERMHPDMIVTRLRCCTVIGQNADPSMMASLTTNPTIMVMGYNPPIQLVHEEDVASAFYLAVKKDLPGAYNVTGDDPRTLSDLVKQRGGKTLSLPYPLVKAMMGLLWRTGKSVFAPEWISLSCYSLVASNEKLKSSGWQPRFTTSQAFEDLLSGNSHVLNHQTPPGT